jgi:hypothetical protein
MNQDQALRAAGDIIIEAFPDMYGSVTFNLQGQRKTVHSNVVSKIAVQSNSKQIDVDMKESKNFE